jgi:hypothetical protein
VLFIEGTEKLIRKGIEYLTLKLTEKIMTVY